ncbi:hypothetical protein BT96DRAFT_990706 [Gymnopus androsaceus JB14]|uniref:Uncharacterized protein n=1 Tax=Gymnopus androsaceus JB14 TaxID=1447944 RepID=A0A6A4I0A7_9AGAR|nr:hypothetical protein BT96DRAFT_990706 [Gymnopus androsaceus JB14]
MPPNINRGGRPRGMKQQRKLHAEIEQGNTFECAIQDKRGKAAVDDSDGPDGAGDLSHELIDSFNGEVPSIVDDEDMESEEEEMMHKVGSKCCLVTPAYDTRSRKHPRA